MNIETVKVKRPESEDGYAIINKCDLTEQDELFDSVKSDDAPAKKRRTRKTGDN